MAEIVGSLPSIGDTLDYSPTKHDAVMERSPIPKLKPVEVHLL